VSDRFSAKFTVGDDVHRGLVHCWQAPEASSPICTAYVEEYHGVNLEIISYAGPSLARLLHMFGDEVQRQFDIIADMPDIDPGWVELEVAPIGAEPAVSS